MLKGFKYNQAGLSLLEIMVAMTIFVFIVLSATQIFQSSLQRQRQLANTQDILDNLSYVFEVMSKEIRMAVKDNDGLCVSQGVVYKSNHKNDVLRFKNQYGECVRYFLEKVNKVNRLKIDRDANSTYVTLPDFNIKNVKFLINNPGSQSSVTIMMDVNPIKNSQNTKELKIQTTLSSRNYE